MALIAVLWIVAALSVLVIGVTATVRQHIQVVGTVSDQVRGQALGEAAMALVLQQLQTISPQPRGITTVTPSYAGVTIPVEVAPLDGLISLNGAPAPLLAELLRVAGGMPAAQAAQWAADLVAWRNGVPQLDPTQTAASGGQPRRFEAAEDLLLVPGIDYDVYARVAPLVSADLGRGDTRVDPAAAPPGVLAVLAHGNSGPVSTYLRQRATAQPGADVSGFDPAFIDTGGSALYRLRASVPLETGKILRLTHDVALASGLSLSQPWRVLHRERQIVVAPG